MTAHHRPTSPRAARGALILAAAGAVLLTAGCAQAPAPADPAPVAAPGPSTAATPSGAPAVAAPAVRTVRITYAAGKAGGETGTVAIVRGEAVRIVVTSDVADEVHLHGYDEEAQLPAGRPVTLAFTADIPGRFELELHESGAQLATLQVS